MQSLCFLSPLTLRMLYSHLHCFALFLVRLWWVFLFCFVFGFFFLFWGVFLGGVFFGGGVIYKFNKSFLCLNRQLQSCKRIFFLNFEFCILAMYEDVFHMDHYIVIYIYMYKCSSFLHNMLSTVQRSISTILLLNIWRFVVRRGRI